MTTRTALNTRGLLLVACLIVAACSGSSSPAAPSPTPQPGSGGGSGSGSTAPGGANRATALIDGVAYSGSALATLAAPTGNNPAMLVVAIVNVQEGISMGFATLQAVGTETIRPQSPVNASLTDLNTSPAGAWLAVSTSGSGTITIATLDPSRATGTFSFTLISTTGGPNKTVTNGTFDVSF